LPKKLSARRSLSDELAQEVLGAGSTDEVCALDAGAAGGYLALAASDAPTPPRRFEPIVH
jgi:hypothetical protein